ncbi:nibrin-like [Euwallacea similis]|uniref:nibrin-like n=1 Tax=Euwallacea similis TaxID=1736056 RepID=UPI00344F357E
MCKYKVSHYATLCILQRNHFFVYLVKKDLIYSSSMVMALKSIPNGDLHILGSNNTYSIGRSRRNHIHLKDSSVGAQHAILQIKNGMAYIQDAHSKHGTWVNNIPIKTCVKLKHKDAITFGKKNCSYAFIETQINIHIEQDTYSLTSALRNLKLNYTRDYSKSNNYYVTSFVSQEMMRSTSILHYLIARKYVVTPKYFTDLERGIDQAPALPNIYRYMPEIDVCLKNKGIVDINPKAKRKTLFNNALFIFFDEQDYETIRVFIEKCCGEALLYKQDPDFKNMLLEESKSCHYVVVDTQESSEIANNCVLFLKAAERNIQKMSNDDVWLSILKAEFNCPCNTDKSGELVLDTSNGKTAEKLCDNLPNTRSQDTERNLKRNELKETFKPGNNMGSSQASPVALEGNSKSNLPNWLLKVHSSSNGPHLGTPSTNKAHKTCTQKEFSKEQDSPSLLPSESTEIVRRSCVENWLSKVLSSSNGPYSNQPEVTNSADKCDTQEEFSKERDSPCLSPSESTERTNSFCLVNWLSKMPSSSNGQHSNPSEVTNSVHKGSIQEKFSKERYSLDVLSSESTERTISFCAENWLSEVLSSSNEPQSELTNSGGKVCVQKEFSKEWNLPNHLPPESTEKASSSCVEHRLSEIQSSSNASRSQSESPAFTNSALKACTHKEFSKEQNSLNLLRPESIIKVGNSCVDRRLSKMQSPSNGPRAELTNEADDTCVQKRLLNAQSSLNLTGSKSIEAENVVGNPHKVIGSKNQKNGNIPSTTKKRRASLKESTSREMVGIEKLKRKYKDIDILGMS